jgi:hypothetical protein
MSLFLIMFGLFVVALLGLLVWSVSRRTEPRRSMPSQEKNLSLACKHISNLPQIRQALQPSDLTYLAHRMNGKVARTVKRERRRVASLYLESLREDFEQLIGAAQVVASLSPEVQAGQEWKRFRLALEFRFKYQLVRARFALGSPAFASLSNLSLLVSSLALEIEKAVGKISEAAALAANPSSANR